MSLERGKLINDHNILVKGNAALIDKPIQSFSVDDVGVCTLHQCLDSFFFRTDRHAVCENLEVIPLANLRRPGISGNTKRRNDKHRSYLKGIKKQVV